MYNKCNFMFKRKICKSNQGVVGIVVAVLLIGLLVAFISIIQMQFVPEWMKGIEAEHMDEVSNQFSELKFAIDTQTLFKEKNILITRPITLGSSEIPFFVSTRSYGQLDIIDDISKITIYGVIGSVEKPYIFDDIGIIKYSSVNGYLEDQTFIYESGAIITSQSEGNFISIDPSFEPDISAGFNISFKIVDINGTGGKISETGYDTTSIRTDFSSNESDKIFNVKYIIVETNYINSWTEFFRSSLKNVGLVEGADKDFTVNGISEVTVTFLGKAPYYFPSVTYEKFVIEAQIGAGIVKS